MRTILVSFLFVLLLWCGAAPAAGQPKKATLLTGQAGNYYSSVGEAIRNVMYKQGQGIEIDVLPSAGSKQNIDKLKNGEADFAIVQSDVADLAWYNEPPFHIPGHALTLVAPLFIEKVQILIRPHLYISSPAELRGKRVWMGARNSGSELSARTILEVSGLSPSDVDQARVYMPGDQPGDQKPAGGSPFDEAVKRLRDGSLDALFQTSVAPTERIRRVLATSRIRLLGLDIKTVEKIMADGMYIEASLQKTDYSQLDAGIFTVGVQALLLAHDRTDKDTIRALAKTLEERQDEVESDLYDVLRRKTAKNGQDNRAEVATDPARLPLLGVRPQGGLLFHADRSVADLLPTRRIPKATIIELSVLLLILCVIVTLGRLHPPGRRLINRHASPLLLLLGSLLTWLIGAVWLQGVEGGVNANFRSLAYATSALAETVGAKMTLPFQPPVLATQDGNIVMNWFSGGEVLLLTGLTLPVLKRVWKHSSRKKIITWLWE